MKHFASNASRTVGLGTIAALAVLWLLGSGFPVVSTRGADSYSTTMSLSTEAVAG